MARQVNIVVTCTNRKRYEPPPEMQLRDVQANTLVERAHQWLGRIARRYSPLVELSNLYTSDHWFVARTIPEAGEQAGLRVNLWVISAGYGLIPSTCWAQPYGATFAPGSPDSISSAHDGQQRRLDNQKWWELLSHWDGPDPSEPRTLRDMVERHPRRPLMVVGSPVYIDAIAVDLAAAREQMHSEDQLSIISAGLEGLDGFEQNLVPCDGRLKNEVKGAMQSLNARVARKIVSEAARWPLGASTLCKRYQGLLKRLPEQTKYERTPMTNPEVVEFIQKARSFNPSVARTPLLRELRARGYACEQSRFAELFRQVQESA